MKHRPATVQVRTWRVRRLLTPDQVDRVRALPWKRGSGQALAKELGVSPTLIHNIRHGLCYKRPELPQQTYSARVTDGKERYSLGSFLTPEAAQDAIDKFARTNKWPRGSVERASSFSDSGNPIKPYRGPPATLGSTAEAPARLIVWCRDCGHQVEPDPAEPAPVWHRHLRSRLEGATGLLAVREPGG